MHNARKWYRGENEMAPVRPLPAWNYVDNDVVSVNPPGACQPFGQNVLSFKMMASSILIKQPHNCMGCYTNLYGNYVINFLVGEHLLNMERFKIKCINVWET